MLGLEERGQQTIGPEQALAGEPPAVAGHLQNPKLNERREVRAEPPEPTGADPEPIEADVTEALTRRLPRVTYPALLEIAGKGELVAIDANGRLDLTTALAYCKALEKYGLCWFEEPVDPLDYHAGFERVFWQCAAQRLMQALGAYANLSHNLGKPHYEQHIPAAVANLTDVCSEGHGLHELRALFVGGL